MAHLFDPIQIGKFEVKKQVAFATSGIGYAHQDGSVYDQNLCHSVARARGGDGWIPIEHGLANDRDSMKEHLRKTYLGI